MIKNQVGLEAEFFLKDGDGNILFPGDHGFSTDDFIILGEFRGKPSDTRTGTMTNFMAALYDVQYRAKARGLSIDFDAGWTVLTPELYTKTIQKMGIKHISTAQNIYDTNITELTDAVYKRNKLVGYNASIGLHVHFSSGEHVERTRKHVEYRYTPISLPLTVGAAGYDANVSLDLYKRETDGEHTVKLDVSARVNRVTKPVVYHVVTRMDQEVYPKYKLMQQLKFRHPGFFEMKHHGGFEYRSLPFNKAVLADLPDIVDFAFTLLEDL